MLVVGYATGEDLLCEIIAWQLVHVEIQARQTREKSGKEYDSLENLYESSTTNANRLAGRVGVLEMEKDTLQQELDNARTEKDAEVKKLKEENETLQHKLEKARAEVGRIKDLELEKDTLRQAPVKAEADKAKVKATLVAFKNLLTGNQEAQH